MHRDELISVNVWIHFWIKVALFLTQYINLLGISRFSFLIPIFIHDNVQLIGNETKTTFYIDVII